MDQIGEIIKWLLLLYAGGSLTWGGLGMIYLSLSNRYRAHRAMAWPSIPGKILESSVRSEGKSYEPEILYEYSVKGKHYVGDRWRFGAGATSWGEKRSKQATAQYPIGQSVTVFFDPQNPADAVLEPGKTDWSITVFAVVFTLGVLAVLILAISTKRI